MSFITIVVVTYNSQDNISECLDSVYSQKAEDFEVAVVDNGSKDFTLGIVRKNWPQTKILENKRNGGLSQALNRAIKNTSSKYILILNDDAVLDANFLKKFRDIERIIPSYVGGISPLILKEDKSYVYSRGIYLSKLRRFYNLGENSLHNRAEDKISYVFGCCLACAVFRREMLESLKLNDEYFDEDFFLILEDFDISWRARKRGWKFLHMPDLVCFHKGGFSKRKTSFLQYLTFRNRYYLLVKNEDNFFWLFCAFLCYDIPRFMYFAFANKYFLRALCDLKTNFRKMFVKRVLQKKNVSRNSE